MPVSEATYRQLSLEDDDTVWELVCGRLREKPLMTHEHGDVTAYLAVLLQAALPRSEYRISINHARLRVADGRWFVPDVAVVPYELKRPFRRRPNALEAYDKPLPLVVEVWSPSTGNYDVQEKVAEYQVRGDSEIWLIQPYDLRLQAWRRQPDGTYVVSEYTEQDAVEPVALPGVRIELAQLFE